MKAYVVWLKTELKRVARRLPSLFLGAIVLALLVGATSFCALISAQIRGEKQEVGAKVALVAPQDSLTDLAVLFVEGMESVNEWCSFERYTFPEGMHALKEERVVALIEIPEDMVESILDGRNIPAKLYLTGEENVGSRLLETMAATGVCLLQTAQGEIYATADMLETYAFEDTQESLYSQINLYNLELVINREQLFKTKTLSETGTISVGAYFGATAVSLFSLMFGLLFADFLLEHTLRDAVLHRRGLLMGAQVLGRWKILTLVNFLWSLGLLVLICVLIDPTEGIWNCFCKCMGGSLYLLAAIACITAVYLLLGNIVKDKMAYMFTLGVGIFACGYVGGYFLPSGLLGEQVKEIAAFLPTTHMHRICSGILAGQEQSPNLLCLILWLLISLGTAILLQGRRQGR